MSIRKNIVSVNTVANYTDDKLCKTLRAGGPLAAVALDELYRRHGMYIRTAAIKLAHKVNFDADLTAEGLESEAISEAFLAAHKAFLRYDGVSCAITTYLTQNIKSRFMDLKRKNAKHGGREDLLSSFERQSEDGESYGTDQVEYKASAQYAYDDQAQVNHADAIERIQQLLSGKKLECFEALLEGARKGVNNTVAYAAEKLGCTRANVYATIKAIRKVLPGSVEDYL